MPYSTASLIHFLHPSRDPDMGPKALPGQASGLLAQDLVSKATATLLPRAPHPHPLPGHRHRLYPAPGASCQLGQNSVPLGADGRSRDPLGSSRATQITGNPSLVVYAGLIPPPRVSKTFRVGIYFHFLGGAPWQCLLLPMNKEELVGLPIDSKYKHGL